MSTFKILILFNILIFLMSCGTVKNAFDNSKKKSTDEFLVEKKSPLLLPPDFDEFPVPNSRDSLKNTKKNEVKKLLTKSKNESTSTAGSETLDKTFSESLLDKIKNN